MMKWNLLAILCFLLTSLCEGQEHDIYYKQFKTEDGFASNEVYDVCEDENGFIWFATDQGIVRYNGLVFKTFTTKDGLEDNTILKFYETDGHIYFNYYKGGLGEIMNSIPRNHIYSDSIKKYKGSNHIRQLIKVGERFFFTEKGFFDRIYELNLKNGSVGFQELKEDEIGFMIGGQTIVPRLREKKQTSFLVRDNIMKGDSLINNVFINKQDTLLKTLWKLSALNSDNVFDEDVQIGRIKFMGEEWYVATENGIYILDHNLIIRKRLLLGVYVTSMHLDKEENLWVTTHNQGVICIPKTRVYIYPVEMATRNSIEGLLLMNDGLVGYGRHYPLHNLSKRNFIRNRQIEKDGDAINFVQVIDDKLAYSQYGHSFFMHDDNNDTDDVKLIAQKNFFFFFRNDTLYEVFNTVDPIDTSFYYNLKKELKKSIYHKAYQSKFAHQFKLFRNVIASWDKHRYYELNLVTGALVDFTDKAYMNNVRIQDAAESPNVNLIALGTKNKGLLLKYKGEVTQINEDNGLASMITEKVSFENDSTLWVASYSGLNRLHLSLGDTISVVEIDHFSKENILPYNSLEFCQYLDGEIWFGSKTSLNYINVEDLRSRTYDIPIFLESFKVNDKFFDLPESGNISLSKEQRNISIKYTTVVFPEQNEKVIYRFKLNEKSDWGKSKWIETSENIINYSDLNPGTYTFSVQAKIRQGNWSSPEIIKFKIDHYLTETKGFAIFLILLFVGPVLFIYTRYLKKKSEQIILEKKIVESEQKALRSQMNPHFIFNALNSVQYYISLDLFILDN